MSGCKNKTIRRILKSKLTDWISSIKDDSVRQLISRDVFITGGSIASLLLGEKINDFDVYFKTKETTLAVAKYYVNQFNEANPDKKIKPQVREETITNIKGVEEDRVVVWVQSAGAVGEEEQEGEYQYFEIADNADGDLASEYVQNMVGIKNDEDARGTGERYRPVFMSQNAITLSNRLQIVIRFYGEAEDIYENYDFVHVCQHYDYATDKLHLNTDALASLLSKTLYYRGSLYPICSVFRSKKFIERGWKISAGQMLKMCYQISELDLTDIPTLREQMTGVDAAYFHQIIRMIEASKEANPNIDIDAAYICELVDKVFE